MRPCHTWPIVAIGDFAEVATGGTPSTSVPEYWEGGTIPWLNSGELNKRVITRADKYITEAGLKHSAARLMPEETVLIALTGATTGISALLKIRASANQSVTGILPSDRHDPRFLLQYLRSIRQRILSDSWGGAQKHISQAYVSELKVPLPPLAEQQRIARVLDLAEGTRAKRRTALVQLDSLIHSLFRDMFGDSLTNPMRWPLMPVADYVSGFEGGKSVEAQSGENVVTQNRVLKVSAVTGMEFLPHESKPVPDSYRPPTGHFARTGDLLFSRANTSKLVGAVAYVDVTPTNVLLPDKLWRFVWRQPSIVEPLFVWALFQTAAVRYEIRRRATGTSGSMKNISQKKLYGIRTIVPPLELQKQFACRVTVMKKIKSAHLASLTQLHALFAALQYRAFRGELRYGCSGSDRADG